jgi:anaerobic selenocysteine-containing dehydrogenase
MSSRSVHRSCTICEATCGISVEVEGRSVTRVSGDALDPFSRGEICPKAVGMRELHEDRDRLRRPLLRGATGFQEISWEEAYARAAEGLARVREQGGADALALYRGNPGIHDYATTLGTNVISRALGTRNVYSAGALDTWPRFVQASGMYGGPLRGPVPDVDRTDYFLMLGANPLVSQGSLMTAPGIRRRLRDLRARGGKLVVVDPRRSETAARADEHHFITPGSDVAFLFALLHVLFDEGRIELGACAPLVTGLEDVERMVAGYTPERVAPRCAIPAETIRRLAREFSAARSAVAYGRMGTSVQRFGTLACWGLDLLCVLTGNLDRPGGLMFGNPAAPLHFALESERPLRFGRWQSRVGQRDEVLGEFAVMALAEEIETPGTGQVRGLLTIAGNPLRTAPNSARLERAIASLDFMVSLDYYVNETTRHANLILPPTSPLERAHYDLALNHFAVRNVAKWSPAVFEPEPGTRDAWQTSLELARRLMGLGALAPAQFEDLVLRSFAERVLADSRFRSDLTLDAMLEAVGKEPGPERVLDVLLRLGPYGDGCGRVPEGLTLARVQRSEHGIDLGPLEPMLPAQLVTASRQIELAPERLRADLPRLGAWLEEAPPEVEGTPPGALQLINRRDLRSMNSWLHNLPGLAKGRERCTLQIHPQDATPRGLAHGAFAMLRTRIGEIRVPVEVTADVMPGVVSLPHGFGHEGDGLGLRVASRRPGSNVNAVSDDAPVDAPSGASVLFGLPVEVERAL